MGALTDAVACAPHRPGVYFFLGPDRELLYVGKAVDLRRRLGDHLRDASRVSDVRRRVLLDAVRTVRWEVCDGEDAALRREADLIVMLHPTFNVAHREQQPARYLAVTASPAGTSFDLTGAPTGSGRTYGTFPHLAKGAHSSVAKRTKCGYSALLRLVWAAQPPAGATHVPARIAGASPPQHFEARVAAELRTVLHDFCSGRSARLLSALQVTSMDLPAFTRVALERDIVAAGDFFALGPRALRRFRLRHALAPGPVPADVMAALHESELADTIGAFAVGDAASHGAQLGRRAAQHRQLWDRLRSSVPPQHRRWENG
jgi:predicted GIY-YIG superfamily endonuclease